MKRVRIALIVVLAAMVLCTAALATAAWLKTFKDTYKPKTTTELGKANCSTCHVKPSGGDLNPYGKMLKGKKVDKASLKAIETKDADKDGYNNITEIKAGKLPGDPKSKPPKK